MHREVKCSQCKHKFLARVGYHTMCPYCRREIVLWNAEPTADELVYEGRKVDWNTYNH